MNHIGIGYPIIYVYNQSMVLVNQYDFPLCTVEGSIRDVQIESYSHVLLNGKIINFKQGVRNIFTLHYEDLTIRDTLTKIKEIINYELSEARGGDRFIIKLKQKNDVTDVREVFYSGNEITIQNEKDIEECTGLIGLIFEFTEVYRSTTLEIKDADVPEILPTGEGIDQII